METGPFRRRRGLTLIELMFGIAVFAILVGIGAPSFAQLMRTTRTTTLTNDFVASLQLARSEAVRRSANVVLCPTTDGASCAAGSTDWDGGWLTFVDRSNVVGVLDGTDELLSVTPGAPAGFTVRTGTGTSFIRYIRNGATLPAGNKVVAVRHTACTGNRARTITINTVGRIASAPAAC